MGRPRKSLEQRFWAKVEKRDGCWGWKASAPLGYGQIWSGGTNGTQLVASRVSWEIHRGPIPEGLSVLHHCDNPPCTNPDHLFLGTSADNSADMIAKGRQVNPSGDEHWSRRRPELVKRGDEHWARKRPDRVLRGEQHWMRSRPGRIARGERSGQAKLTQAQVDEIRAAYSAGEGSYRAIGLRFGVSSSAVHLIVKGIRWKAG